MTTVTMVPAAKIRAGNNDRKHFDPEGLRALAASIASNGLAQPPTIRPVGDEFEIVAGERRVRAMVEFLNWEQIPCLVRELTDEQASAIMLAENTGRADLDPIEEANAYASRIAAYGWTTAKLAEVAGVSEDLVKRRLLLLDLHPDVQQLVAKKHLPLGHAEVMVKLDHYRQLIALRIYREAKAMPLNTYCKVVSDLYGEQAQDGLFDLEAFWMSHAAELAQTPVRGKKAVVNVPTRADLPQPEMKTSDTTSAVIMRYIMHLDALGFAGEAAAIGTLYRALIHSNSMALPDAV
jgi:ParB/RepB/Spo0J family partition protein